MRTLTARYAGVCAQCSAHFPKGSVIGFVNRRTYCSECAGQYRRDLAADDLDMMTGGY